jgi:hypothetical protein
MLVVFRYIVRQFTIVRLGVAQGGSPRRDPSGICVLYVNAAVRIQFPDHRPEQARVNAYGVVLGRVANEVADREVAVLAQEPGDDGLASLANFVGVRLHVSVALLLGRACYAAVLARCRELQLDLASERDGVEESLGRVFDDSQSGARGRHFTTAKKYHRARRRTSRPPRAPLLHRPACAFLRGSEMASHRLEVVPLSDVSGTVIGYGTGTANEVAQLAPLKWSGTPAQETALEFVRIAALQRLSEARADAETRAVVKVDGVSYAADSRSVSSRLNSLAFALRAPALTSLVPATDGSLAELDAHGIYDVCAGVATFLGACAQWESTARASVTAATTIAEIQSAVTAAAIPDFSAGVPAALRSQLPESILSTTVTCGIVGADNVTVRGDATIVGDVSAAEATFGSVSAGPCTLGSASVASLNAGSGDISTTGRVAAGRGELAIVEAGTASVSGTLTANAITAGTSALGVATATSIDAGSGAITTTGALNAGQATLGATSVASIQVAGGAVLGNTEVSSLDIAGLFQGGGAAFTGLVTFGSASGGPLEATQIDTGSGTIKTTGAVQAGSLVTGPITSSTIETGAIESTTANLGDTTAGALTASSVNAGSGAITTTGAISGGTASIGTISAVSLGVSGTVTTDLTFASVGAIRRLLFAGPGTDSGWVAYYPHDSSANNPWFGAGGSHNSVMELGVGDDAGLNADSLRIEGGAGIYLKATDRVISSAKIEARGGLDALGHAIQTTGSLAAGTSTLGAVTCGSLNAGTGAIQTSGSLGAGPCTLGAVTATSFEAGSGAISTTGTLTVGTATIGTLTSLNLAGAVNSDMNFSASGSGVRRIHFAAGSDSGWIAHFTHDSSANNPWYNAASTQNAVMELGVGDDIGINADCVRIQGCMGIYLKAADRVISSAKIEARGG